MVIGDIAHIVAHSTEGPRADPDFLAEALDTYANWILLCAKHHRLVDARPATYDAATLLRWKDEHEAWVAQQLGEITAPIPPALRRTTVTLYRIASSTGNPWATVAAPVNERWRDPTGFSVRYAAETAEAAMIEVMAGFGPSPGALERMSQFLRGNDRGKWPTPSPDAGTKWLRNKVLSTADVTGVFADIEDENIRRYLDARINTLTDRDGADISDFAAGRRFLQNAHILFETGRYDGIVYPSRHVPDRRTYVLFDSADIVARDQRPLDA